MPVIHVITANSDDHRWATKVVGLLPDLHEATACPTQLAEYYAPGLYLSLS